MSESVKCAKCGAIGSTSNELPGVAEPRLVCSHCWDALRAELEAWKSDAERLASWLENVHIDYSNGNIAPNGMDEGYELGWKGHKELLKAHHVLLGEIEEGEECNPTEELPF